MAGVSPCFFTHYKDKNWIYKSVSPHHRRPKAIKNKLSRHARWDLFWKFFMDEQDDNLYINRWMKLISMPDPPDFVQIISWNDYGESHYVGPKLGTPPADTTWLWGISQAWNSQYTGGWAEGAHMSLLLLMYVGTVLTISRGSRCRITS